MRDIRSDLQERATLIEEQIRAAYAHFEKIFEQIQHEHDARIADLKSGLAMVAKFMEFEQHWANVSPAVPTSPLVALADLFMRRLNEAGPMSREELVDLAVREGFFPDAENAVQGVHPMLVNLLRSEQIRELPNGTFAPPTLSQAIKPRRVV
jgi:enamine deaminase RidA (YjgF/YER057c/UK114 family)